MVYLLQMKPLFDLIINDTYVFSVNHAVGTLLLISTGLKVGKKFMEELDYKKEIIKMLDKISSSKILRYIYIIVSDIVEEK